MLVAAGWSLHAAAQQATLTADAHVYSARPSANSGSLSNLNVGGGYTAFLQFDLSALPANLVPTQVARATLRLYCNRADTPGNFSASLLTSGWSEGGVTYATSPSTGATITSGICNTPGQFVALDVTGAVQSWLAAPSTNFGLALTASTAVLQFDSKENDLTGHAPELDIAGTSSSGSGVPGATGTTGATGSTGPQGLQGVAGNPGPQGIAGPAGTVGATGATGAMGPAGLAGAAGATGAMGPQGIAGVGTQGAAGPAGPAGAQGLAGSAGSTGAAGPTGPNGALGPAGAAGATGATGAAGPQGPPVTFRGTWSSSLSYFAGDAVSYLGSSYAALQANTGTQPSTSAAYWSLLAAAGAAGPSGAEGAQGPAGTQGTAGAQGPAGQAGAQGLPGPTGFTGLQGPAGGTGAAGPTGLNFRGAYNSQTNYALADGVLWQGAGYVSLIASNHGNTPDQSPSAWALFAASGAAGATGASGPAGPQGATGTAGVGLPGTTGATGATGTQGAPGLAFQGSYSSTNSYSAGDTISYLGSSYVSLAGNNHGNTPGQSPSFWAVLALQGASGSAGAPGATGAAGPAGVAGPAGATGVTGLQGAPIAFRGAWSSSQTYSTGDTVSYSGSAWIAVAANSGKQPDASSASWSLLASVGAVGPVGAAGAQGAVGQQGIAGPQGPAGQGGAQGAQGVAGPTGPQGPTGATGAVGAAGLAFRGPYNSQTNYGLADGVLWQGSAYISLVSSNLGNTPDQSPAAWSLLAAAGLTGATGASGPAGTTGVTGATGIGLTGSTGAAGATGPQGAPGLSFQGTYLSITSYNAGDAVSYNGSSYVSLVTNNHGNTPDASPAFWAVLAAQGQAGTQGVTGATGATGSAGVAGAVGATGAQGPPITFVGGWLASRAYSVGDTVNYLGSGYIAVAANSGRQPDVSPAYWSVLASAGAAGVSGATGATGSAGAPGLPGATGATGLQGAAGATGAQGATGLAGLPGTTGSTGSQGVPGVAGSTGAKGSTGTAGVTGATGTPGAPGINFRAAWIATATYTINDAVTFGGSTYLASAVNTNSEPDVSPQVWGLLAQAGATGPQGPAGAGGPAGAPATISIAPVTVLPAGSQPTVTNTGTSTAAVLAFGLPAGGSGSTSASTAGSNFAAVYHPVSYNTLYYSPNTPNASLSEATSVLAWVPRGCTASRLDVYSQQSGMIKVTLRSGTPGNMADTSLVCDFAGLGSSSCKATGAVTVNAGSFLDFRIDSASGTTAGVWTALECDQ